MSGVLNLTQYMKQAYTKKAEFIYRGTAALKKGHGMCFDLDYANASITGEKVTDPFGARGLKEVQIPRNSNNNAFAGVLTQNYAANPKALTRKVQLALPGSCAMISQRVESTINAKLVTCVVGEDASGDVTNVNGLFGHGGFYGLGSAIPLETLAAATGGDLAFQNVLNTATTVYDSVTNLTTVTMTTAGTALGYVSAAVAADGYEMTVWGGATENDQAEVVPSGVYPVVQALTADTFTVTGDTGDGACTINLVKKDFMTLAYLCDGAESGLSAYYVPVTAATTTPVIDSGMIFCIGGLTMTANCDLVINDGTIDGQLLGFYQLADISTSEVKPNITSGFTLSGSGIAGGTLSTISWDGVGEWASLVWRQFGPADSGAWQLTGASDTGVVPA